ncbi:protein FAM107B-like isoform X1 [Labeo rohita]|uniref:Protein FAM107B-like isoform X1 n=1 Tax=Labeo rohita TaxID=84645 RepID=A0A498NDL2_LABRO|nr:protein FAM107B-like isoform X1 [Labeo rohita]
MPQERDPFPFPRYENDYTLTGSKEIQKLPYDKPTHLAQDDEPWRRLHNTTTQASSRRNVFHCDTTRPGFRHHRKENYVCHPPVSPQSTDSGDEIIQLRKLNGSPGECPSRQNLHKELLLGHKRGLLLEEKPELQRVLQQRRLDLHREQELALRPPSDLEQELRKRQQKLQEYEMEEQRRLEDEKNVPEFVRVKENLRRIQLTE